MWALPLLLSIGQTSPPPAPPGFDCQWVVPNHPEISYDLTSLQQSQTSDIEIVGSKGDGSTFHLQICAPPKRQCTTSMVHDPSGVNTWSSGGGLNQCGAIGSMSTAAWGLQNPSDPAGGAQIQFTGGDPSSGTSRSSTVKFKCDPSKSRPVGISAVEGPVLHYTITIAAAAACAITPQPLSWGWWTIIFSGVAFVGYLGGGIAYNMRVRGEEGLDVIPQWQYWQQLPGLVKDGASFSWAQSKVLSHSGRRQFRDWMDNRGSKELRAPIAAAAE